MTGGAALGSWAEDPTGRHQYRWWDGSAWTSDVLDDGRRSIDGLPHLPPPTGPASKNPSPPPMAPPRTQPLAAVATAPAPQGAVESVRTCLVRYADLSGRAARPEFWWFVAFQFAVGVVAAAVFGDNRTALLIVSFSLLLPHIAVTVRRLHDTGRSAWWALLGAIPFAGLLAVMVLASLPGEPGPNAYGPPPA